MTNEVQKAKYLETTFSMIKMVSFSKNGYDFIGMAFKARYKNMMCVILAYSDNSSNN